MIVGVSSKEGFTRLQRRLEELHGTHHTFLPLVSDVKDQAKGAVDFWAGLIDASSNEVSWSLSVL